MAHTKSLKETLGAQGTRVACVAAELSDRAAVDAMLDEATRIAGGIDILYNNAAIMTPYRSVFEPTVEEKGSNWFIASGALTESGYPLFANDPHLALDTAATFSESHMVAADTGLNVTGVSFPGVPGIGQKTALDLIKNFFLRCAFNIDPWLLFRIKYIR